MIALASPAAGNPKSYTVPDNMALELRSVTYGFTASGAAGNRFGLISVTFNSNTLINMPATTAMAAGFDGSLNYALNQSNGLAGAGTVAAPLGRVLIPPKSTIAFDVLGIDAADTIVAPTFSAIAYPLK